MMQPVNMFPANSMGFYDVYGNVWEWCEDHYNSFPGFQTHYLYDDYSTTYCDGKHNLMLVCNTISLLVYTRMPIDFSTLPSYSWLKRPAMKGAGELVGCSVEIERRNL